MAEFLPRADAALIVLKDGTRAPMTREYYDAFRRLFAAIGVQVTDLQAQQATITALLSALGVEDLAGLEALDLTRLQQHSDNLDAITRLYGSGLAVQVSLYEWAARSLAQPAAGLTITNPDGTAGNPTFALANDLAAVEGLGTAGLAVRTGADAWTTRTLADTATIEWANGNGVVGDPAPSLKLLADAGGGTLRKITRDGYGRISGSSAATTDDLAEGATNLYWTAERTDDRVAALIVNSATVTWSYDDGAGTLTATFTGAGYEPAITAGTTAQYWRGDKTWQALNKAAVGLGNVDNTSDADKPVSTAQATANTADRARANHTGTQASATITQATARILGRTTAGAGATEELSAGAGLTLAGGALGRAALTGDVTAAADGNATTISDNVVTNAKLADVATATFKGRTTAGTGDPEDLTATQATALLNTFTSALKGLVPASSGGTANFLRADGTFAAPPSAGGYTVDSRTASYTETATSGEKLVKLTQGGGASPLTVTLPTAVGNTATLHFKLMDAPGAGVTLDGNGSQTIDGALTKALTTQYQSVTIFSDNANWLIV